jgi:Spy/CpxP family protein refolding chaperone
MTLARTAWIVILFTLLAAAGGGWAGIHYGLRETRAPNLDEFLHHKLELTADQDKQIASLETEFAARRKALDQEMRAANRELADTILKEHVYGVGAKAAIERFHTAAAALQEATIMHVLAMRAVLTPEQAQRFDTAVSEALRVDQS